MHKLNREYPEWKLLYLILLIGCVRAVRSQFRTITYVAQKVGKAFSRKEWSMCLLSEERDLKLLSVMHAFLHLNYSNEKWKWRRFASSVRRGEIFFVYKFRKPWIAAFFYLNLPFYLFKWLHLTSRKKNAERENMIIFENLSWTFFNGS